MHETAREDRHKAGGDFLPPQQTSKVRVKVVYHPEEVSEIEYSAVQHVPGFRQNRRHYCIRRAGINDVVIFVLLRTRAVYSRRGRNLQKGVNYSDTVEESESLEPKVAAVRPITECVPRS
jgi:hypothetical protein